VFPPFFNLSSRFNRKIQVLLELTDLLYRFFALSRADNFFGCCSIQAITLLQHALLAGSLHDIPKALARSQARSAAYRPRPRATADSEPRILLTLSSRAKTSWLELAASRAELRLLLV